MSLSFSLRTSAHIKYFQFFVFPKEKKRIFCYRSKQADSAVEHSLPLIQPDFCRSDFVQISGYSNKTSGGAVSSQGAGHHNSNQIPQRCIQNYIGMHAQWQRKINFWNKFTLLIKQLHEVKNAFKKVYLCAKIVCIVMF